MSAESKRRGARDVLRSALAFVVRKPERDVVVRDRSGRLTTKRDGDPNPKRVPVRKQPLRLRGEDEDD